MGLYDRAFDAALLDAGGQVFDIRNKKYGGSTALTNIYAAFVAAIADAAAVGGGKVVAGPGEFTLRTQVPVDADRITIELLKGCEIDITNLAGDGTSAVHSTGNVLAGFKATGDDFNLDGEGKITGAIQSSSGAFVVGALLVGCARPRIGPVTFDTLYSAAWPVHGVTDFYGEPVVVNCSRNIQGGAQDPHCTDPQVTGFKTGPRTLSYLSLNDGCKLNGYVYDFHIQGTFRNNLADGVDTFIAGDRGTIDAECIDNGQCGMDVKQQLLLSATSAGGGGFNRRVTLRGVTKGNAEHGVRVDGSSAGNATGINVDNLQSVGNTLMGGYFAMSQSSVTGGYFGGNGSRGMTFYSCDTVSVEGTIVDKNALSTQSEGVAFSKLSSGAKNKNITMTGVHVVGSGTTSGQRNGVDATNDNIEQSRIYENDSHNHVTDNWVVSSSFANADVWFRGNLGFKTEGAGSASLSPDGSGNANIAHGLAKVPASAHVDLLGDNTNSVKIQSVDATNITCLFQNATGGDLTAGTFTVYWRARIEVAAP